jgi:anion-transporting  ArsA/GET3 family ATPase
MTLAGPGFVLAIVAICTLGWVLTTWIRARHGYPVENELGGLVGRGEPLPAQRALALLETQNERLAAQLGKLEERLATLERIVTDPARSLADSIERLR